MAQEASAGAVAVQFLILIALVVGIGYFIRSRVRKAASKQNARQRAERPRKGMRLTSGGKKLRVHELATELGITRAETVALCQKLGVPVKSDSSSLNETYADMVRRRAAHDGLTRDEQPAEPEGHAKNTAAKRAVQASGERDRESGRQAPSRNDEKINLATELYLLWIDNGDGDMPVHPKVRAHYTELARMRPACPVDVEAMTWLKLELKAMSDDAIRQTVRTAAARMAGGPAWDQAHRDNIDDFIRFKNGAA